MTVLVTRGLGHNGGVLATSGLGRKLVAVAGGGAARRKRVVILGKPFTIEPEEMLPDDVSQPTKELILEGETIVQDMVLKETEDSLLPELPEVPELGEIFFEKLSLPERQRITLLRTQELREFEKQLALFQKQVRMFDEELMMFLILTMEC